MVSETNSFKLIPVSDKFAKVDREDYEYLRRFRWTCNKSTHPYAKAYFDGSTSVMHRLVARCPESKFVDHINGDTLDNRRCNVRICTTQQNIRNMRSKGGTSKYKGVSIKRGNAVYARIMVDGKNARSARCQSEHEAALLYDSWATDLFGEFAWLNASHFPELEVG